MKSIENFTVLNTWALLVDFLNEHWFIGYFHGNLHSCFHGQLALCDTDNESAAYKESF